MTVLPPPGEGELDRRVQALEGLAGRKNDRWVAIVSVVGSLVVALATVLGSISTNDNSVASQATQARNDFLRQQKQVLYSRLITESMTLLANLDDQRNRNTGWTKLTPAAEVSEDRKQFAAISLDV